MYSQEYNLQNNLSATNKNIPNNNSGKIISATNFLANKMHTGKEITDLNVDEITYIQKYLEQVKHMKRSNNQNNPTSNPSCTNISQIKRGFSTPMKNNYENPNVGYPIIPNKLPYNSHNLDPNSNSNLPPSVGTRPGKKMHREDFNPRSGDNIGQQVLQPDYYNPYEYGSRQNQNPSYFNNTIAYQPPSVPGNIDGINHSNQINQFDQMGLSNTMLHDNFPGHIRNVNVESSLWQQENTHTPGQRRLTNSSNKGEIDRFELLPFDPQDPNHIVWPNNMPPRGGYMSRNDRLELA